MKEILNLPFGVKIIEKTLGQSSKKCYLCSVDKNNCIIRRLFKVKEIIDILISQGWYKDRQYGTSHRQFKHPTIRRTVTVDGKLSFDFDINNLKSMERQSGLKFQDFVD